ncbi:MAG: GIY-YIG nuclease family protein [Bacteroidota bacterium]
MSNQYFVYILLCSDESYYVGVTNDIDRRMQEHDSAINPRSYTALRRPLKLVFVERFTDINQAIAFEKQVKGWGRKKKEAIIKGNWHLLPELSKNNING